MTLECIIFQARVFFRKDCKLKPNVRYANEKVDLKTGFVTYNGMEGLKC